MSPSDPLPEQCQLDAEGRQRARRVLAQLHCGSAGSRTELPTPTELQTQLAPSDSARQTIKRSRREIAAVLRGHDPRLLVVVGPCSAHDPVAVIEYAERLQSFQEQVRDTLLLCMRVYFDKPRTSIGWKGFINDPHMDESCDMAAGLRGARSLLIEIAELGVPTASELLDPIASLYINDLLSWAAIGARTSESQTHRELASAQPMPVGLKHPTCGNLDSCVHGLRAIAASHRRLIPGENGHPRVETTPGNNAGHMILRGGRTGTNYDATSVAAAITKLTTAGLPPRLVIDASHGNSGKVAERQVDVLADVEEQLRAGQRGIAGVMLESHLAAGNQAVDQRPLQYGVSVTDACLGVAQTEQALLSLHRTLSARFPQTNVDGEAAPHPTANPAKQLSSTARVCPPCDSRSRPHPHSMPTPQRTRRPHLPV